MAAATQISVFRNQDITKLYTVPVHSDLVLNSTTFKPGDLVQVLSTGVVYLVAGPDSFFPLSSIAPGAAPVNTGKFETDFRDTTGEPLADTDAAVTILSSGLRIHGQGIAEADSGAVISYTADGNVCRLTTTDEAAHLVALSFSTGTTETMTPATHGPIEISAVVSMVTALTDRALFLGVVGAIADALDPVVTGSTTTITLVQDDLAGLYFDSGLTAATRIYMPYNKADGAASIATTGAGVDTGVDFSAAGTYVALKLRIEANGDIKGFVNGVQVSEAKLALTAATAVAPVLYIESNAAAVKAMDVKYFGVRSFA